MKIIGEVLDEGKWNRKVLWEGKFDASKLDFKDKFTDLSSECKIIRYLDSNLNDARKGDIGSAIYDLTSEWGWPCSVDEEKTEFYINLMTDQFPDGYAIQAFCKPCPFNYSINPPKDSLEEECKQNQEDFLAEIGVDGGEWANFDLELTDAEKIELLEYLAFVKIAA